MDFFHVSLKENNWCETCTEAEAKDKITQRYALPTIKIVGKKA